MRQWLDTHPILGNRAFRAIAVFLAGFVFDVVTLDRIDSVLQNLQQIAFLVAVFILLRWELRETSGAEIPAWLARVWKWKDLAIQFLLGGLLSAYLLFFFKSASIASSLAFLALMCALLILNEFVHTRRFRVDLHLGLFATCLTSFWIVLVPMLAGSIRAFTFHASIGVAAGTLYLLFRRWIAVMPWKRSLPIFGPPLFLLGCYLLQLIPPVPLAVKSIGVYRSIEKKDGKYVLTQVTSPWYFWRSGDQLFQARPGEPIVLFMKVFAPRFFEDRLYVVWKLRAARGLETWDRIPLTILGGREEGFRGYVKKANYVPGNWIASLETEDGREVGRLNIQVEPDPSVGERTLHVRME